MELFAPLAFSMFVATFVVVMVEAYRDPPDFWTKNR